LTYDTWGNNPDGLGTGLLEELDPGRAGVAQRSVYLDDLQEARLMSWIQRHRDRVTMTRVPQIDLLNAYRTPGTPVPREAEQPRCHEQLILFERFNRAGKREGDGRGIAG